MAKTAPYSALTDAGFRLAEEGSREGGRGIGTVTTRRFTKNTGVVGEGTPVRPITHTVFVQDYGRGGKPDVHYEVTQGGQSYVDGYYDTLRRHKSNWRGGTDDPIGEVLGHHNRVVNDLKKRSGPAVVPVTPENLHSFRPDQPFHATPFSAGGLASQINTGPAPRIQSLNATQDKPLDPHVHRWLTGGAKGRPTFEYLGRLDPEEGLTDVYHSSREDPEDPYMRYGFTVRHMPSATATPHVYDDGTVDPLPVRPLTFSYNATHYPIDMPDEHGEHPIGDFMNIPGVEGPVANFTDLGPLIERHHNTLRSLGLMDLLPRDPRPAWHFTAALARTCPECGGNDVDFMEIYGQGPDGLHSVPTGKIGGQCNDCYSEFTPRETLSPDAAEWNPSMGREAAVQRTADEFDNIVGGNNFAGPCWACGKATYNYPPETGFRDDKSSPMTAEEETNGEMHGPSINMCQACMADEGPYSAARSYGSHGSGRLWQYKEPDEDYDEWENGGDAFKHEARNKARRLMDEADEDLRP